MADNETLMKNILFVHYGNDWIRGSEVVLLDMLTANIAQGEKPILWCNSQLLADAAKKIGAKVIVDRFVCLGYWTLPRWDVVQYVKLLKKAKIIIKTSNIDIVHCNNGGPCQWLSPICKLTQVPLILHLHARYQQRDRLTLLFHFADRVIGVSQSVIDVFGAKEFEKNKLAVVYNGISPDRVLSNEPINIRQLVAAKKNESVVLYIGSLIPRKGLAMLVKSLEEVNKKYSVKTAIFGSGEGQSDLKNLVEKLGLQNTIFFFPAKMNVAKLYSSNANYFISTPKEEVFGLTLGEASLAGLPVISTCVSGVDEIYTDHVNALLVPSGNSCALSQALIQLIEKPELAKRLMMNAREHIKHNFSIEKQSANINKQYVLMEKNEKTASYQILGRITIFIAKLCILKFTKKLRKLSIGKFRYG